MNKYKINSHGQMQLVDSKSRYSKSCGFNDLTDFYEFKNNIISSDLEKVKDLIKKRIIVMNLEKQNRHFIGTNEYKDNKSFFICSLNELNELVVNNIEESYSFGNSIVINLKKQIGVVKNENGRVIGITKYVKLHVSKTGFHVVPRKEN